MVCSPNIEFGHDIGIKKWGYSRSSAVSSIVEVSDVKAKITEERKATKPSQVLDKVIPELLKQIENGILIPILKTKTQKRLIRELENRFDEFYELRRSIISAFMSYFANDKDFARLFSSIKNKAEKDFDSFLEKESGKVIGMDASLSIIFALNTNKKVNRMFLESLETGVIDEKWIEKKNNELHKLEFAKTFLDLCLCSLFLNFRNGVSFEVRRNILRTLAFLCKSIATSIYNCAKELDIIKFPKVQLKEHTEIESDEEDMYLAEAGLEDYVSIIKSEERVY